MKNPEEHRLRDRRVSEFFDSGQNDFETVVKYLLDKLPLKNPLLEAAVVMDDKLQQAVTPSQLEYFLGRFPAQMYFWNSLSAISGQTFQTAKRMEGNSLSAISGQTFQTAKRMEGNSLSAISGQTFQTAKRMEGNSLSAISGQTFQTAKRMEGNSLSAISGQKFQTAKRTEGQTGSGRGWEEAPWAGIHEGPSRYWDTKPIVLIAMGR